LVPPSKPIDEIRATLPLDEGRKLYKEHLARPRSIGGVKPSTWKRYHTVFDKFLPFAESKGVPEWVAVDAALLIKYASYLDKLPRSPKTQRNELVVLVQTIKWLIDAGHLPGKEYVKIKFAKVESQRAYCWRQAEVVAIVQFCQTNPKLHWLGDVATALACTGLRISELAAMRWGDIDFEKRMLYLPDESGYAARQGFEPRDRKSGRSRSFPIHAALLPVLVRQRHIDSFVFHGPRGGRLKPDSVRTALVKNVIEKLAPRFPSAEDSRGFSTGRLHSFRHFFVSHCANEGVPMMVVMRWLGHTDSLMTQHYYHLYDRQSQAHMERLDPLGNALKNKAD
jgi:integrase